MPIIKVQESTAARVAEMLLEIGAVKLNIEKPFTWASGIKSPIYCDNRLTLSFPPARNLIKQGLREGIMENYPSVEAIAGVATAGIAPGVLVADLLSLPFLYVRPKPKDHGMANLIEGKLEPKQQVVVVEDLVSTGGSSLKAVEALTEAGAHILGMISIFSYGFDIATRNFYDANISLVSLSDYGHLIKYASLLGNINEEQLTSLKAWRVDPSSWKY